MWREGGSCGRPREVTWLKISLRCAFNFIFYLSKRNYNIFSATNTTDSVEKQQFADWLTWQTHEQRNQVLPERKERNFPSTQTSPTTQSSDFPRKLLCKHWKLTMCHILISYCLMDTCKYVYTNQLLFDAHMQIYIVYSSTQVHTISFPLVWLSQWTV